MFSLAVVWDIPPQTDGDLAPSASCDGQGPGDINR